jgi:hypothetical protein
LVVAVGLQVPNGPQAPEFFERATMLRAAGAGVLAIIEAAPPAARISPVGAAVVVRERVGSEVLLPVEAADRNLAALRPTCSATGSAATHTGAGTWADHRPTCAPLRVPPEPSRLERRLVG